MDESLQDSEERFRNLLEAIPDIVYRLDENGCFTYVNGAVRTLGFEPAGLLGKHFSLIIHPDDLPNVSRENVLPHLRGKETGDQGAPKLFNERRTGRRMTKGLQVRLIHRDRQDVMHATVAAYGEIISTGQYDRGVEARDKKMVGTVGIIRDVTDRRRVEESRNRLAAIVESSNEAIIGSTLDYVITSWNKGAEKIYGYTAEEVIGQSIRILLPAEVQDFRGATRDMVARGETPTVYECRRQRKDGTVIDVQQRLSPIHDIEGKVTGISSISHDITNLKKAGEKEALLREQLLHSEKMRALGEVLSGAAHELNNPLTAILGYAQLMFESENLETGRADLKSICAEAKRCSTIVQSLVAFARKKGPRREPCRVNDIIRDTVKLRAYQMTVDGVRTDVRLDEEIPMTMADMNQLQQVFLNIINNALAAVEQSPEKRLVITSVKAGETIRIAFQDCGHGIPKQVLPRIFEPFFTTKEVGKGTGLGLSVCYGIITDHGGSIHVESVEGKGATFTIELPIVPPPLVFEFGKEAHSSAQDGGGEGVLVVEDEDSCRIVLERHLAKRGYRVVSASNVKDAIRLLHETPGIHLIISDHKMPGQSGEDLYRHVAEKFPALLPRFILVSGDLLNPSSSGFIQKTGLRAIEKPFGFDQLNEIVSNLPPLK